MKFFLLLAACLLAASAKDAKKSNIVPTAGEVELWAGNGDVSLDGAWRFAVFS